MSVMSIKYKIPALMMILFILNVIVLWLFFNFYSAPRLTIWAENGQVETDRLTEEVAGIIDGGSLENGLQILREHTATDTQVNYTVINTRTKERIIIPEYQDAYWEFSAVETVALSGDIYTLLLRRDFSIISSLTGILYFLAVLELKVLSISFIFCGVIIHLRYVRPILRLKNKMLDFLRHGRKLKTSKRTDELGELENSFCYLTEELTAEKDKQNRIIASISHDIKTPLTSIMGFSERLLKKELDKKKQLSYLKSIFAQSKNIETMVEEFDEYLKFSMDNSLTLKRINVSFLYELLKDEYTEICSDKGVVLVLDNKCLPDSSVNIDIAKMRRVFANLIGNSIRHNNLDGLEICVTFEDILSNIQITVADNGRGVPDQELVHIFEPFFTSDKSRKVSGLGLSICEQIIKSHDGRIRARNSNRGFVIQIELPQK